MSPSSPRATTPVDTRKASSIGTVGNDPATRRLCYCHNRPDAWSRPPGKAIILAFAGNLAGRQATQVLLSRVRSAPIRMSRLLPPFLAFLVALLSGAPAAAPVKTDARRGRARLRAHGVRARRRRPRSRCGSRWRTAGTRTGRTRATPACRPRSPGRFPQGVTAGAIQWPAPHALPAGPLVNYGYEGEVLLLADVHVPPGADRRRDASRSRPRPSGWSAARPAFPRRPTLDLAVAGRRARRPLPAMGQGDRRHARRAAARGAWLARCQPAATGRR